MGAKLAWPIRRHCLQSWLEQSEAKQKQEIGGEFQNKLLRDRNCPAHASTEANRDRPILCEVAAIIPEYSETLKKVSVLTNFAQSQLVSVSTTSKCLVSKNLGLDNSEITGLKESRSRQL